MKDKLRLSLKEIIDDFNREIELYPEFADAYSSRGMVKFCLNDLPGAFMDWSTAVELGNIHTFILIRYLFAVPDKRN